MITHADANDEQFLSIVQSMADLDFLDPTRFERITSSPDDDAWYIH